MQKRILKTISFISLALALIPSLLVFAQIIDHEQNKNLMLLGTLGWFTTAPFWMKKNAEA